VGGDVLVGTPQVGTRDIIIITDEMMDEVDVCWVE
jgi:hypothetical protein